MAIRGVEFKWYDGLLLSLLATSIILMAINWDNYNMCEYTMHIWTLVDYTTLIIFGVSMFVDNRLAAGLVLDFGRQQCDPRFCGRVVVLSILALLLYPFMWFWTVVGTLWFIHTMDCLPEVSKWIFFIMLIVNSIDLACITIFCIGKWLRRRRAHLGRAQHGNHISEFGILVDMVRVPDWAFEATGQMMKNMGLDAATYHPGFYSTIRVESPIPKTASADIALETAENGGVREIN